MLFLALRGSRNYVEKNLGLYDYEALDKVLTKVGENLWPCILFIVVYKAGTRFSLLLILSRVCIVGSYEDLFLDRIKTRFAYLFVA